MPLFCLPRGYRARQSECRSVESRRARYNECVETRRMCPNCRAFITTSDKVCPYCEIKLGAPAAARRAPADLLGGLIPHARFTTIVILLINAGFYLAEE